MASAYFSSNVTKYNNGGSGDNIIANGYIKSVEKVWVDTYTIAFVLTKTTLDIAVLPANAKLLSIAVMIETSASQTSQTLSLGFGTDAAYGVIMDAQTITHNLTTSTILFPGSGVIGQAVAMGQPAGKLSAFQSVIGTNTTITLQFNNWTSTTGTVKSVVRYT